MSDLVNSQDPIEEIQTEYENERVENRVKEILSGIKPLNPNVDMRMAPTIDAKPHQEPKGFLEKVGDGIVNVAESIGNAASSWADNRLQNMSMEIYGNLYDPDPDKEKRLEQAHKIGDPLGLPAQMLVDSKEAYEMAQNQYAWMKTQEIMQGRPFSANALKELYPEIAEIAMDDPVSATLALKQADQILHDRGVIVGATAGRMTGEPSFIAEAFKNFSNAYDAGQNMDEISEVGYAAKNGEISVEEMNRKVNEISARTKEYEGDSVVGNITYETVKQLSMMKTQMLRSLPIGAAAGLAGASVIGAPVVGAMMLGTILFSSYRANAGSNYYRLINKKNADGTAMYTATEAKNMADREAAGQAVVETGLMTLAYGSIGKVFGKSVAKAAIMNAATRKKLITASRAAMSKYAAKEALKQYAKGTGAEVAEEGWQDFISNIDEKIVGRDKSLTLRKMWDSAADAMLQAVPAAIGMGFPGAVLSGAGNFVGLSRLSKADWAAAKEAFYRENEKQMVETVIKERDENRVFKISPETFRKKTQAQMDKEGMGSVYIDAASAAEEEKGVTALNQLVEKGAVSAEAVDTAIKDGSPLEIKSGVYMQTATEETAEILSDHATFDKEGSTLHNIEEARKRLEQTVKDFTMGKEQKEGEVAETILNRDFEDGDQKEAMRSVFAGGLENIEENYEKAKKEAYENYEELIGYKHYAEYEPQGVDLVPVEAGERNYQTGEIDTSGYVGDRYIRQSNNEKWYSDAWKKYGRKPNKSELYDIAEEETLRELQSESFSDEERQQAADDITRARKNVETLESLNDYVKALDKRDIEARTLLKEETYEKVYLPTLETLKNAPEKVSKAAKDSALVYAKMVENFSDFYKIPVENIMAIFDKNQKTGGYGQQGMTVKEKLNQDSRRFSASVDLFMKNELKSKNVKVMTTPLVMKLTGADVLPVYIHTNVLAKILKNSVDKNGKHGHAGEMTPDIIKQLPQALIDPMAIVRSDGKPVVITCLKNTKGQPIVVPFILNKSVKEELYYSANIVESAYGKRSNEWIKEHLLENPLYINKNRTNDWRITSGLQLPMEAVNLISSKHKIPDEEDLVKLKEQNPGYYQKAYHGSPYTFDRFDLGAIGSGSGTQAHGWGLYFTKKRKAAVSYRMARAHAIRYKGKSIEEFSNELERVNEWDKAKIIDEFIMEQDIAEMDMDNYDKETVEWFKEKVYPHIQRDSSLIEAEVPDNEDLLDEDLPLNKQSEKVRKAIAEYYNSRPDDYIGADENNLPESTGARFYDEVKYQMKREGSENEAKDASLLLNKLGIKGIRYEGGSDGECFVVFDDKAIQIINRYNQKQNEVYRGAYDPAENAIRIFEAADQSTVIHEGAHWWLSMLEQIALDPETEELAKEDKVLEATLQKAQKDRDAIYTWASYSPEVMKEYKGTALAKEFKEYENAIKKDPENKEARERFIQERFARGFERYLMTGKAPSKEMRGVFRRFKKWLVDIYNTTKEKLEHPEKLLGLKDPSREVKEIFDHMVAVDTEIENWAAERRLNAMYDKNLDYTQTERENIQKWAEEIKELAKEDALKYFMEKLRGEAVINFEKDGLPAMVEDFEKKLLYNKIYQIEEMKQHDTFPTEKDWKAYLKSEGFTEESYKEEVERAGGTMEERAKAFEEKQRENFLESISDKNYFRDIAESLLESPEGRMKLAEIEQKAMGKQIRKYARIATASLVELDRLDPHMEGKIDKETYMAIKERNGLLTEEDRLKKEKREQDKEKKATVYEINDLKIQLRNMADGLKQSQEMTLSPWELKRQSKAFLYGKEIYKATNYKWWGRKAEAEGNKASQFLKMGKWSKAAEAKFKQARFAMNAQVAKEYDNYVRQTLHGNPKATTNPYDKDGMEKYGIAGLVNRVNNPTERIRMTMNTRYFIQHLAYQLGLNKKDGRAPLGADGQPTPFDWKNLNAEMDIISVMEGQTPEDAVPLWLKGIFNRKEPMNIRDLTIEDFDEVIRTMKKVYKVGRREYEGNSFKDEKGNNISFEEAEEIFVNELGLPDKNPLIEDLKKTYLQKKKEKAGEWVAELALPEILIERMGEPIYNLIYKTMSKAADLKRSLENEAKITLAKNMNIYTREEWRKIRSEKIYEIGKERGKPILLTKEELLTIALNWGTFSNRDRVQESYGIQEDKMEKFLVKYLEEKDWDFVERVWEHIDSYWGERNKVQNRLYGIPLGKVPGITFMLPNGRKIEGSYYPIRYDGDLAGKTKDREINEIIKREMLGRTTFGLGMGSTKKRASTSGGQYLRRDLDVYIEIVNESINHIAMREATADIYKLLSRRGVSEAIENKYGVEFHRTLLQWASDCWHDPVDKISKTEKVLNRLRQNFTMATMAYRTSTALLNLANLPFVIEKMGAKNAARGLSKMYLSGEYKRQREFILEKSTFMRSRATTMDKDLARGMKLKESQNTWYVTSKAKAVKETLDQFGYSLIAETDFMFSLPEWLQTYNNTILEMKTTYPTMTAEEIDAEAVRKADKMVRETFGSGEMKDRPAVAKSRFLSQLLPFYSFTSLVMNQFVRGGYDIVDGRGPLKLMRAMLFWYILGSIFEGAIRSLIDRATGNDKYSLLQRIGYSFAGNGPIGGIPVARDAVPAAYQLFAGMYSDGGKASVTGLEILEDIYKTGVAIKSDKKDWMDVGQSGTKVINKATGLSDTLTDGIWALARLTTTDTDATAFEAFCSMLFDRRIKKKGEKK